MKVKIVSLPLLLGFLLLFTQCEKDTLDPLADDDNGSKKTIIAASDDGSNDDTDDEADDQSGDEADDQSGDEVDDQSGDQSGDEANDQSDNQCGEQSNDQSDDQSDEQSNEHSIVESVVVQDLWAGAGRNDTSKGIKAGTVSAEIIAPGILRVKYETESPWSLSEAHLWVGNSLDEIPKNAAPGKFTFKQELDYTYSAEFEVNLDLLGIDCINDPIFIAAHCVVGNENESAWAFGDYSFISLGLAKKWGWIFRF